MSNSYVGDFEGPRPTGVDWQGGEGNWGIAKYGDDRRAIVFFHKQSVWNEIKSQQAGRRIYDEMDFVSIQHPGEREQKIDRPMKPDDKFRWPTQWAQYQNRQQQTAEGTPIDLLFATHPGIADNLKSFGISTVEQLANLSSTGIQNVGMGAQDYVNYARSYLEHAQKGVGFHEMQAQLRERDQKIKLQGQQIENLVQQVEKLIQQNAAILQGVAGGGVVAIAPASKVETFSLPAIGGVATKLPASHGVEDASAKN